MPQTPGDKPEPSLELPSLKLPGFGRRKKAKIRKSGGAASPEATAPLPESDSEALAEDPTPADVPLGEPSPDTEPILPVAVAPAPRPETEAEPEAARYAAEPDPAPHDAEPTQQILAEEPTTAMRADSASEAPRRKARRERSGVSLPTVPGRVAAAVTGLLVGVAGAAATYGAMAGCKAVRGVSTCGGAPGFFILVAIVILMILLGAGLLKAFKVGDPGSTSFLAVGVVTVVVMLALLDVIFSASMFVVIPFLSAVAYLMAHWVTTRFDGEQTGRRDWT